jgi:hypothetical protein
MLVLDGIAAKVSAQLRQPELWVPAFAHMR